MTERYESPEIVREDYPEAIKIWGYAINRPLERDELEAIVEGTGVRIWTNKPEEFTLGHGSDIYLGSDEEAEKKDPFPRANIQVTRRPQLLEDNPEGVEVFLQLIAKPSDNPTISPELWEADRQRNEDAVLSLGGERII